MPEYRVTITETLKMDVVVEAESREQAEEMVGDGWRRSDYVLDSDYFDGVVFKAEDFPPTVGLSYKEMTDIFKQVNQYGGRPVSGYIVFSQSNFEKPYSIESRTYEVSNNNKAFIPGMGGYSVYGSSIDGTDVGVRLDRYIRADDPWEIERCYMKKDDYEAAVSQHSKLPQKKEAR